jgi:hypothetical protein
VIDETNDIDDDDVNNLIGHRQSFLMIKSSFWFVFRNLFARFY